MSLPRSAIGCSRPIGPTRFGPWRVCRRPISLRSKTVMKAKNAIRPLTRMKALMSVTNTPSGIRPAPRSLQAPSTGAPSQAKRTAPAASVRESVAVPVVVPPAWRTATRAPSAMPRRSASSRASTISSARWNASRSVRATAAPENSGRRPIARSPSLLAAGAGRCAAAGASPAGGRLNGERRALARSPPRSAPRTAGTASATPREGARRARLELELEVAAGRSEHRQLGRHACRRRQHRAQALRAALRDW